ncbi:ATP-binding protein [Methylobacterium sp. ID0610]|uniref:ATP-binding protein n=1 Tax=Methylobacterium carpenticola TaxID=3344827 RepID=UPI00367F7F8C
MTNPDPAALTLFAGQGEMRALARALDWSRTPLGPVSAWPQSLRSTVRTLLSSQYPMILTWGSEFTQIYNDAYAKLIGAGHPAALGNDIRITLAAGWDTLGPMIARVMQTGEANWTPALPLLMERAGYREEAYFSVSHAPAEDDDGRIVGMLAVCSEVTAQVVGERRLGLLRDLAAKAGESRSVETTCADIAAALSDDRLDVPFALLFLREAEGGLRRAAVSGIDEAHPAASPSASWPFERALAGESVPVTGLAPHVGMTGGFWGDPVDGALTMPIAGEVGSAPLGVLVVGVSPSRALDAGYAGFLNLVAGQISTALRSARAYEQERRRAEALAELDRAKTQFFSNVSHEFRTPLTLMLGPLEEVLAAGGLETRAREELEVVHRNALRLLRLVNTLLDFSRVEAGRAQASFAQADLAALTADIASTFRSAIERGGLTLTVACPPLPEPTYVDREMWEKVVLNLLSNALKFTFQGGITVRLEPVRGAIRLTVSDTGVGIPAEALPQVFERFHRIAGSRSRSHEGTGIGLALVRELVGMHGGTVAVTSRLDRGTTFTVTLPTGTAHLPPDRIVAAQEAADGGGLPRAYVEEALRWLPAANVVPLPRGAGSRAGPEARSRIVLADDNADMRAYVARLLGPDHDVVAVADGGAALAALRGGKADLLLTDVMMPVLDGIALTRAVRGDPALCTVPVIMLSARAGAEAGVEGLEAGADDYLVKPFSARELQARVRTNLELARLRREAEEQEAQNRKMEAVGQLTSGVAHDFNNLLAAVMGSVELAERRVTDERVLRLLRNAHQAARRGATLTEQLLAFSRRQRLEARPTDLNGVLSGMADLLHRTLGGTIAVATRLSAELWPALADPNRIELAVLNLAVNARDAMPEGGELRIETTNIGASEPRAAVLPPGDFVRIRVTDTGEGMPPAVLQRLFEPFFTTKPQGKGTGLGLAQVYGTAKQLGGEVTVESRVGEGTTVSLYLPRARGATARVEPLRARTASAVSRRRVLLVDDDPQVRATAEALLEEMGHAVVAVGSGAEALHILGGEGAIDLLLADYAMPGMTGSELATRALALQPSLRVLLMTGYADAASLPDGAAVLRKPFALSELAAALAGVLPAGGGRVPSFQPRTDQR